MFSVTFTVTNTLLASMVSENEIQSYCITTTIFVGTLLTLIYQDFDFEDVSRHTVQALIISCVFACLISPAMVYFSKAIIKETMAEARLGYVERDSYR